MAHDKIFSNLNSMKAAVTALHYAGTSKVRPQYECDNEALIAHTKQAERVLDLTKKKQFIGTFPLMAYPTYQGLFLDKEVRGKSQRRRVNKIICTYVITNTVNGMVYVGSTEDFADRWAKHAWLLNRNGHTNIGLQAQFDEYGADAFTIAIIDSYSSTDNLISHERDATRQYDQSLVLNYYFGKEMRNDWTPSKNTGLGRGARPPKTTRGKNKIKRWHDA